uniref:Putative DinI-like damage-inducible protein n=1 Tax=Klebsiella pneumoniae TaxID=573 RepID=A0A486W4A9_KLEPN|nr:putative DinI-like damage-inducible protein [Klebsiella pneumoniae]
MRIEIMIDKEQKISQSTLDALESELYRNLRPLYPKTVIRIRKGSSNGVEGFVNGMVASHLLCHSGTINRHSLNGALLS